MPVHKSRGWAAPTPMFWTFFIHTADSRAITGPAAYLPKQLTALSTAIVDN